MKRSFEQGWALFLISVSAVALSSGGGAADLASLPPDQQATAKCMLAVASTVAGVTNPNLRVSDVAGESGAMKTFLNYTYHHRTRAHSQQTETNEIEITDIIATKRGGFYLSGHTWPGASDLDDNDLGMLSITRGWDDRCGLDLLVIS